jgi:hypothetical protein
MTTVLLRAPDQSGYTTYDNETVVATQLDGGMSRSRRDILNASSYVDCQWTCDANAYKYMRMFYRNVAAEGAIGFYCPLYLDFEAPRMYFTKFKSGSLKLKSQSGLQFVLSATLELERLSYTQTDLDFLENYASDIYSSISNYTILLEDGSILLTENGGTINGEY